MSNYIPEFILHRAYREERSGVITGVSIRVDLDDFNKIADKLGSRGTDGAVAFSALINDIFGVLVDEVYRRFGFIARFKGDAFTFVFPADNPLSAYLTARSVQTYFDTTKTHKTVFGDFPVTADIGMSFGDIGWGISGSDSVKAYYFEGETIDKANNKLFEKNSDGITLDEHTNNVLTSPDHDNFEVGGEPKTETYGTLPKEAFTSITGMFVPSILLTRNIYSGFYDTCIVAIAFARSGSFKEINDLVSPVLDATQKNNGYFYDLSFNGEVGTAIIIFGVPEPCKDNLGSARSFVSDVLSANGKSVKAAMCCGKIFAGLIGTEQRVTYAAVGNTITQTRQLALTANWGEVLEQDEVPVVIEEEPDELGIGELDFIDVVGDILLTRPTSEKEEQLKVEEKTDSFYGQEQKLEELSGFIKPIYKNEFSGICYVYGEQGIGKTRLLNEFAKNAIANAETEVVHLTPDPDISRSFSPFIQYLHSYFEVIPKGDPKENRNRFDAKWDKLLEELDNIKNTKGILPIIAEINRTKPVIAALLGMPLQEKTIISDLDAKDRYLNRLFALKNFLKAQCLLKPTILIVDDLADLDNDSRKTLENLTINVDHIPLAIVVASRVFGDDPNMSLSIDENLPVTQITLNDLDADAMKQIAAMQLGGDADNAVFSLIETQCQPNPLYIEQFVKYLLESLSLEKTEDGTYQLSGNDSHPDGLKQIVIKRLKFVGRTASDLIEYMSASGASVTEELLRNTIDADSFNDDLAAAIGSGILIRTEKNEIAFSHPLIKDIVYETLLSRHTRVLHLAIAQATIKVYNDDPEHYDEIAQHFIETKQVSDIKEYLDKAATYARNRNFCDQAIRLYEQLLSYVDPGERVRIKNSMTQLYNIIGDTEKEERIYRENIKRAKLMSDEKSIADNERQLGLLLQISGDIEKALKHTENAYNVSNKIGYDEGICASLADLGALYTILDNKTEAEAKLKEGIELSTKTDDYKNLSLNYDHLGDYYLKYHYYDKAEKHYLKWHELALDKNDRTGQANASMNLCEVFISKYDYDDAFKYMEEALELYKQLGKLQQLSKCASSMGELYFGIGNLSEAMEYFEIALGISKDLADEVSIGKQYCELGAVNKETADYETAERCLTAGIDINQNLNLPRQLARNLYLLGELHFEMGAADKAKSASADALTIARGSRFTDIEFSLNILELKIASKTDAETAIKDLENMLNAATQNERKAIITYEISVINDDENRKTEARELIKPLYESTKLYIYRKMLFKLGD